MTRRGRGLSLVELVISIALLGILAVPTGMLLRELLVLIMNANDTVAAVSVARYEMERLDAIDDFYAADFNLGTTAIPNYQGTPYTLTRTLTCALQWNNGCTNTGLGRPGSKRIVVVVTRPGNPTPFATLQSLRTKNVSYGL